MLEPVHRWVVAKPHGRAAHYVTTVLIGVVALAVGLLALWHPVAFRSLEVPQYSEPPGVWGVGALVVPVVLIGLAVRRAWWAIQLDLEANRRRHPRK